MEVTQTLKVGSRVKITNCKSCPDVIGRIVTIKSKSDDDRFTLNFGRGRPQRNRPEWFDVDSLELVEINDGDSGT